MLTKHKRWFRSWRVRFPFVSMSASWFLVSMHLIWILGSELILSNNRSRATLWVLETCLIVGLLPFMIILITASLSSKIYNRTSLREEFTLEEIKINIVQIFIFPWIFFRVGDSDGSPRTWSFWFVFPWRTVTIRSRKSSAGIPSNLNPASKEMISDSVELCVTEVCFLHIQLIGTNVWLPKMHNVPPDVDFESSRSPAKSESWYSPNLHCFAVFSTWQYCLQSHVWWMSEIKRDNRLSHALVHFVIDRANLFTDHRISGRPIRAKYKHFRTIWEHSFDNSPTDFNSSSLKWWSSMLGVDTLWSWRVVLFANSQFRSTHFLAWPSITKDHEEIRRFSEYGSFSVLLRWNSGFKHGSVIVNNVFAYFTLSLSTSQVYMVKEWCWFSQINFFV